MALCDRKDALRAIVGHGMTEEVQDMPSMVEQ